MRPATCCCGLWLQDTGVGSGIRVAAPESASAPRQQAQCPRYPLAQITHSLCRRQAAVCVVICFGQGVMIPEAARRQAGRSPSIGVSRALQPFVCMWTRTNTRMLYVYLYMRPYPHLIATSSSYLVRDASSWHGADATIFSIGCHRFGRI